MFENGFFMIILFGIIVVVALVLFFIDWIRKKTGKLKSIKEAETNFSQQHFTIKNMLEQKFYWYTTLSAEDKTKFFERLINFMAEKRFVAAEMPEVSLEMKVLLSATAIQITFGQKQYLIPKLKGFLIYPSIYFSRINQEYHKGGYNVKGVITLSYEHFLEGIADAHDGKNLGLHEMAHVLMFDLYIDDIFEFNLHPIITHCKNAYYEQWQKSKETETPFFRAYALTNEAEFFAVCVENFFERPEAFYQTLPNIYNCFAVILQQMPFKVSQFKTITPVGNKLLKSPRVVIIPLTIVLLILILSCAFYFNELKFLFCLLIIPYILSFNPLKRYDITVYENMIEIGHVKKTQILFSDIKLITYFNSKVKEKIDLSVYYYSNNKFEKKRMLSASDAFIKELEEIAIKKI